MMKKKSNTYFKQLTKPPQVLVKITILQRETTNGPPLKNTYDNMRGGCCAILGTLVYETPVINNKSSVLEEKNIRATLLMAH